MILNGGLWRVCFWIVRKLLILERETEVEPATSSLGTPDGRPPQPPMKTVRIPMLPCTSWNAAPRGINDLKHVFSKEIDCGLKIQT